jgi:hypothetical protein
MLFVLGAFVAGCGSSSNPTSTSSAQQRGAGGPGFASDPKVVACLKKQGVTVPNRGARPPGGGNGGAPPANRPQNGANSARFQKLRAALQKCGVTPPNGSRPGSGAAPSTATTS